MSLEDSLKLLHEEDKNTSRAEDASKYFMSFNDGLANLLGAPVDLTNALIGGKGTESPILGSSHIKEMMQQLGFSDGKTRDGWGHRAARIAGESALPATGMLVAGKHLATKSPLVLNHFQKSLVSMYQKMFTTMGAESVSVIGSATGGEVAKEWFPDNEAAEVIGEMMGGVTSTLTLNTANKAKSSAGSFKTMFTEEGAKQRAGERLSEVSTNLDQTIRKVMSETELDLDAITASEDKGLAALMKAAMNNDHKLLGRIEASTLKSMQTAKAKLASGGDAKDFYTYLKALRLNSATKAQASLLALDNNASPVAVSRVLRESIESSLEDYKSLEKIEWGKLDTKSPVNLDQTFETYADHIVGREITADPTDYPAFVRKYLGDIDAEGVFTEGSLYGKGTVGNVKVLRTRIGQEIRVEKAKDAPDRNKIRLLTDLDMKLLDDIEASSDEYSQAVAISRDLNQKFRQGKVGQLLGYEKTGELSTSADGTLDFMFSGNKDDIRMGLRQLKNASPEAYNKAGEGIKSLFIEGATENGYVKLQAAKRFLANKSHMLDEFPDIKGKIEQSITDQKIVDEWYGDSVNSKISIKDKEQTAASIYLNAKPDTEIHSVLTSRTNKEQGEAMLDLVKMANADSTGAALKGLKTSFGKYLIKHSTSSDANFLSGKKMLKLLDDAKSSMSQLYTPEELTRIKKIAAELKSIELRQSMDDRLVGGKVINDKASKLISIIGGTFAARTGAQAGAGTSGAALRTSSLFTKEFNEVLAGLTNDKAQELLIRSVEDKELLSLLLSKPTAAKQRDFAAYVSSVLLTRPATTQSSRDEQPQMTLEQKLQILREAK